MAIKAVARRPWGGEGKTHDTWYEPFADAASIERGVRFTLSTPGVHALCTPGDIDLFPYVFDAASAYEPLTDDERAALLGEAEAWPSIFPIAEHAIF